MTNQTNALAPDPTLMERIVTALETIRPALQIDGGDLEVVDFNADDGILRLRLTGACEACPISTMTLKHGIERRIRAVVPEVREVQAI